jgi:hypothetical protein
MLNTVMQASVAGGFAPNQMLEVDFLTAMAEHEAQRLMSIEM